MIKLSDFTVGQDVVLVHTAYHDPFITHEKVAVVGRKYVTISGGWKQRFYINHDRDNYLLEDASMGSPGQLYPSEEAFHVEQERKEMVKEIHNLWPKIDKLSMDQLRRILNAIKAEDK